MTTTLPGPSAALPPASTPVPVDEGDPRLAVGVRPWLAAFNAARVVSAADLRVALRLGRLTGEHDDSVMLAVALAVRAVRSGSVCVRLDDLGSLELPEDEEAARADAADLPWPDRAAWADAVARSPLVAVGVDGPVDLPARWVGGALYLDRYWRDELAVRHDVDGRLAAADLPVAPDRLAAALARLFPAADDTRQRLAAAHAATRRLTILTGGPGTGKTTTVARLLAVLHDAALPSSSSAVTASAAPSSPARPGTGATPPAPGAAPAGGPDPVTGTALRVALAAPTGKAAARLQEAVREVVAGFPDPADRERVGTPVATTLHRLLGYRPGSSTRFRHDAHHHLPHDVVVVDETSMVALPLMARLLEALRPDARLVLVGDPDQLASVEAGAVLGDLVHREPVAPPASAPAVVATAATALADSPPPAHGEVDDRAVLGNGVVRLRTVHRQDSDSEILPLASAIRTGDAEAALTLLRAGHGSVEFLETPDDVPDDAALAAVRADAVTAGAALVEAARAGDATAALDALARHRVMVAHRRGPAGRGRWAAQVEAWVEEATGHHATDSPWVAGRPLLVTANDAEVGLYNGDTGVLVAEPGGAGVVAVFGDLRAPQRVRTHRLPPVETVHAMTVHRAQGSQFDRVTLVLPPATSPLLTRELLYTAVTRAQTFVRVVGSEDAVRTAVTSPVHRASGLRTPLPPGQSSARSA
ncbi:exodeoxyribonuclease V subunit alpha [Cellulosimicrobium cellulans]|uniref:exodeoxyribonuclease V subunit alpha n=1 Tax=Cellulosimicrobium cellulans TaxID=1710 RepID=UPI001965311F|nr:exodeoxyribonuclease V subunit alpha [Cellulosimicrobium cellulans]MBN0039226.1 exodeoxyribonuclease V subunit alpha [Cellulosimicrobium cellulans]